MAELENSEDWQKVRAGRDALGNLKAHVMECLGSKRSAAFTREASRNGLGVNLAHLPSGLPRKRWVARQAAVIKRGLTARNKLVERYQVLTYQCAARIETTWGRSVPACDGADRRAEFASAGNRGLIAAVEHYSPEKGRFEPFANRCIS